MQDEEFYWQGFLVEMANNPADQSGMCRQELVFHDHAGFIEFQYSPGEEFEIYFFGKSDRLARVIQQLKSD